MAHHLLCENIESGVPWCALVSPVFYLAKFVPNLPDTPPL